MDTDRSYILFILNFPEVGNKSQSIILEYNILFWKKCSKGKKQWFSYNLLQLNFEAQVITDILKEVVLGFIWRGKKKEHGRMMEWDKNLKECEEEAFEVEWVHL